MKINDEYEKYVGISTLVESTIKFLCYLETSNDVFVQRLELLVNDLWIIYLIIYFEVNIFVKCFQNLSIVSDWLRPRAMLRYKNINFAIGE